MPDERRGSWVWMALALVLLAVVAGGYFLYTEFGNPFFMHMPQYKESEPLVKAVLAKRPLTDGEYAAALRLCMASDDIVRLRMFAVVAVEARRDPARRPAARAALGAAAADTNSGPRVRAAATAVAGRVPPDDAPGFDSDEAEQRQTATRPTSR